MSLTIRAWRTGARREMAALLTALIFAGLIATPVLAAAPVAVNQSESVRESKDLDIFLDASDADFDPLSFLVTNGPDHGVLADCSSAFCTYSPTSGYVGPDSFEWHANDGTTDSNTATFSITVTANVAPVAFDAFASIVVDSPGLMFFDASDDDFDDLTLTIVTGPLHGDLTGCLALSCTYTPDAGYTGPDAVTWKANDGLADSNTAVLSITVVPGPVQITSAGPLTRVFISTELNCAVNHISDTASEFYGDTACATLIATGGTLYRPSDIPAGGSASPFTSFTPVSQSDVTGSGTAGDPYQIVTVVALGSTGLTISETDRYVVGQEVYRTDVTILNSSGTPQDAIVYRAGDCYLQNSDHGFGAVDVASGAVSCVAGVDDGQGGTVPGTRIEQWYPLSAGSSYIEDFFATVWGAIGSQTALPNTCLCDPLDYLDNGAGLSWNVSIPAGGSVTRSHLTVFSPLGIVPLTTEKTVAQPTVGPGAAASYTITIQNPNTTAAGLDSITDTLPAGFTYTAGSTTGATTSNPTIAASTLTWSGPFSVPASGSLSLTFGVTVSSTPGGYDNQAGAAGTSPFVVIGTGPTAHVTVTAPSNTPPSSEAGGPYAGAEGSSIPIDGTASDPDAADTVTQTWSYTLGAGTDAGMTCSFGNASAVDTTITCTDDGTVTVKLTVSDGVNLPVEDTAVLTIANADPTVSITSPTQSSSFLVGATVNVSATIGDAGSNDSHTCSIDWGDGTTTSGVVASGTCTGSHAYASAGGRTITVTVTDDDLGDGSDTVGVTIEAVDNPPPTSDAGGPYSGTEGSAISLDGTVSNEPGTDTVTQTWSYTLGAGTDAGMTCSFGNASAVDTTITCTDDGTVTVGLAASDGVNAPVEDTATLTIANANPTVVITSPGDGSTVNVGATVNLTASWGDPGSNDTHTCSIDWGDGTITTGTLTATTCTGSHAYAAIGAPAIVVTITDDDGGSASDEILLVVAEGGTKVTGGGWIMRADGKLRFGLVADSAGATAQGELQVRWGTHRFHGKTVASVVASKPHASWSGSGRYDGSDGYTYEVTVVDNGSGGGKNKTSDTFAIVIRDAGGTIVFSASGPLGGGNIKVH